MDSIKNRFFFIIGISVLAFMQTGCASMGTVFLGSAFGLAGQQGIGYFASGSTKKVFYSGIGDSVYTAEKSLYQLCVKMKKKNEYPDGTIRITGKTELPGAADVEVTLRAISKNVTEIVVVSRKGIFSDRGLCHTIMEKIAENIKDKRPDKFADYTP